MTEVVRSCERPFQRISAHWPVNYYCNHVLPTGHTAQIRRRRTMWQRLGQTYSILQGRYGHMARKANRRFWRWVSIRLPRFSACRHWSKLGQASRSFGRHKAVSQKQFPCSEPSLHGCINSQGIQKPRSLDGAPCRLLRTSRPEKKKKWLLRPSVLTCMKVLISTILGRA